jgi:hypothetical protein
MAVEEPRARIVREEPDRNVIPVIADAHNVPDDRIDIVVGRVTSTADNMERMTVQVDRVLE